MNGIKFGPKKTFHMFTPSKRIADSNRGGKKVMGKSLGKVNKGLAPVLPKF